MSQNFLPPSSWIHHNRDLDIAWSREHDEHFRIGHLNAKLRTHHDFLEPIFCFDFFQNGHFERIQTTTTGESSIIGQRSAKAACVWPMRTLSPPRQQVLIGESSVIGWKFAGSPRDDRRLMARALWLVMSTLLSMATLDWTKDLLTENVSFIRW